MRISDIPSPTSLVSPKFPSDTFLSRALIRATARRSRRLRNHRLNVALSTTTIRHNHPAYIPIVNHSSQSCKAQVQDRSPATPS